MLLSMTAGGSLLTICYLLLRLFLKGRSRNLCRRLSFFPVFRLLLPVSIPCLPPLDGLAAENPERFAPFRFWLPGYLTICAVLFFFLFIRHFILLKKYDDALPASDPLIQEWLAGKKGSVPFTGKASGQAAVPFTVKASGQAAVPFVYGLFHPIILLPAGMRKDDPCLFCLLEHEYTHILHRDICLKYLAGMALCVHWFNPLCWILFFIIDQDIEFACDETVAAKMNRAEKAEYARLLLSFSRPSHIRVGLCQSSGGRRLEKRIRAILKEAGGKSAGHLLPLKKITLCTFLLMAFLLIPSFFTCSDARSESQTVPDVAGMALEDARNLLETRGLSCFSLIP